MGAAVFALCVVCRGDEGRWVGGLSGFYGRGVTFHLLLRISFICHASPVAHTQSSIE